MASVDRGQSAKLEVARRLQPCAAKVNQVVVFFRAERALA
jgi:hypothetical protein